MALIKWSGLISEVRGKLNGTVFARNRYAAYARNKVTPINPQTTRQQEVRNMFATQSKAWRLLTQEERNAWNRAVSSFLTTNIFGDTVTPSGFNLFIRINLNLQNIKRPTLNLPPVPTPINSIKVVQFNLVAATNTIEFIVESNLPITHRLIVFTTRPLSPGISNAKKELRMMDYAIENVMGHPEQYKVVIGFRYISKYGNLIDFLGQRLFIKITPIDIITGLNGISINWDSIIL